MSARDRIIELPGNGRLAVTYPDLTPIPGANLEKFCRDVLERIIAPDVFSFRWPGSGIRLDRDARTHYPVIGDEELREAMACPVPHERIWLETDVRTYGGRTVTYAWSIERIGRSGFRAWPVVLNRRTLAVSGAVIRIDADEMARTGEFPILHLQMMFRDYERYGDPEEFKDHGELISRFVRILSHPRAIIEDDGGAPPAPAAAAAPEDIRGAVPRRATVRIDPDALLVSGDETATRSHRSPVEHHRRAHVRRGRNGRVIQVRECIVNRGGGPEPLPQAFEIS